MYDPSASVAALLSPLSHRLDSDAGAADKFLHRILRHWRALPFRFGVPSRFEEEFAAELTVLESLSRSQISEQLAELRTVAGRGDGARSSAIRALAMVVDASARHLDYRVSLGQASAAWSLLRGAVAVLEFEEDRRWSLLLAAAAAGLLGFPTQVMHTTATRGREFHTEFAFLFANLNLQLGIVSEGLHKAERSKAYSANVALTTIRQAANDHLLDKLLDGGERSLLRRRMEPLLRPNSAAVRLMREEPGLVFVDEADQQLIDRALMPVTISGGDGHHWTGEVLKTALMLSHKLDPETDFIIDSLHQEIELTPEGQSKLYEDSLELPKIWGAQRLREGTVAEALVVRVLLERHIDYEVEKTGISLLRDYQAVGRPALTRERLQLLKLHESISEEIDPDVLSRISVPQFFRRYALVGGVCISAAGTEAMLWEAYGTPVVRHREKLAERLSGCEVRVHLCDQDRLDGILERIQVLVSEGELVVVPVRRREFHRQLLTLLEVDLKPMPISDQQPSVRQFMNNTNTGRVIVIPEPDFLTMDLSSFPDLEISEQPRTLLAESPESKRDLERVRSVNSTAFSSQPIELYLSMDDNLIAQNVNQYLLDFYKFLLARWPGWTRYISGKLLWYALNGRENAMRKAFGDVARIDDSVIRLLAFSGSRN